MVDHSPILTVGNYPLSKTLLTDLTKLRPPFNDVQAATDYYGKKLALDWELHSVSPDSRYGYDGALFSTTINGKPHYFLYHHGTNNLKDVPSFLRLANGKPPQQLSEALNYYQSVKAMLAQKHPGEDVPLIQTGYSLGGTLAILAADKNQPVIAFDPPGTKKVLHSMGRDTSQMGQHVLEILSPHPNFANSQGEHVGQIITAGDKFWKTEKVSVADFMAMSEQTHRLKNLGLALENMSDFRTKPAQDAGYPSSAWDALNLYLKENLTKNSSLGERLLASTVNFADLLKLDNVLTKTGMVVADFIAGKLSKETAREDLPRPKTHPDIHYFVEPSAAPQQDFTPSSPQRTPEQGFAERIITGRQQPVQSSRTA